MTNQAAPTPDNMLGVCHAIGETFGFNPLYLRLTVLVGLLIDPEITVGAYAIAGIAVLVAKLATRPNRKRAKHGMLTHA